MKVCLEQGLPQYLTVLFQELFPANKRSCEHFSKYFTDAGLKEISDFARNQQSIGARKELQKELLEQMSRGDPLKDVSLVSFSPPLKKNLTIQVSLCVTPLMVALKDAICKIWPKS